MMEQEFRNIEKHLEQLTSVLSGEAGDAEFFNNSQRPGWGPSERLLPKESD